MFLSRASDHYPRVRVELGCSRPDPTEECGATGVALAIDLMGAVRSASVTMVFTEQVLPLPRAGAYRALVHVHDDPELDRLEEGSFARTAEQWLVQLWSVEASTAL